MSVTVQILLGSTVLGLCALIQILLLVGSMQPFEKLAKRLETRRKVIRLGVLVSGAFALVVLAHTIHVWVWAFAFIFVGDFDDIAHAIYFSLSTYTTVGYGDIIVGPDSRIFAAMESVSGLLSFGLSTAYLASFLERLFLTPMSRRSGD